MACPAILCRLARVLTAQVSLYSVGGVLGVVFQRRNTHLARVAIPASAIPSRIHDGRSDTIRGPSLALNRYALLVVGDGQSRACWVWRAREGEHGIGAGM